MAEQSYEQMILRLEEILKQLEGEGTELARSLALFEEGVHLSAKCNHLLDEAQQKVKILMKKDNGEMVEEDFALSAKE